MAQVVKRLAQAFLTFCHLKHDRQLLGVKALIADVTKYIKLCVGQNRLWQAHHLTVRCIGRQDIRSHGADVLRQAHHQFLADGVDGRVGNLRKLLTEVVEQHLWTVADDCQWCIVTHRGYWLLSCCGHWHDGFVDILLTEAEGHQLALQVAHAIVHLTSALQLLQTIDNVKGRPLLIYSDGLNEAENKQQEQFGDDRLLAVLNNSTFSSSRQVIEKLFEEVNRHRDGAEPNDDLTIMCLKVS